jgi:hypothetical protein
VAQGAPSVATRPTSLATRPERASVERPVAVAQPSAVLAAPADAQDRRAQGAPELDLSSMAATARAEESERTPQTLQRRSAEAPALEDAHVAPGSRTLQPASATATPPTLRGHETGIGDRPSRGLPEVALLDRTRELAPLERPIGPSSDELPAAQQSAEPPLGPAAVGVERERVDTTAPERFRLAFGGAGGRDAGAVPQFRPLAAPAVTAMVAPRDAPAARDPWEHTPYRTRFGEAKLVALEEHGGNVATESAVAAGLAYLARVQHADGHWGDAEARDPKYGEMSVGKTALCMLAVLGAGHTPASGTEYSGNTNRAVTVLLSKQDAETGHFGRTSSYSHAIATYALAECYALTSDSRLGAPLQRAVDWIVRHQHRQNDIKFKGGWGYYYPDGRSYDPWPRTSVTVWQVMALESARLGGLRVPDRAFDDARTFLMNAHDKSEGVILYNHAPERLS